MDKQLVVDTFRERVLPVRDGEYSVRELELEYVAETIAQTYERETEQLRQQVRLDLTKMADMAGGLRRAEEFLMGLRPPKPYGVIQDIQKAQRSAPSVLWGGNVQLAKVGGGMRILVPENVESGPLDGLEFERWYEAVILDRSGSEADDAQG